MRLLRASTLVAYTVIGVIALAACGQEGTPPAGSSTSSTNGDSCSDISTVKPDTLTVATSNPAFPPYVLNNDPTNGKGFESATAYALASAMGFDASQVAWTFAPFAKLFAPGQKDFDFALNQISITAARQKAVTFSEPYYEAENAVLVLKDSQYANATSVADFKDAKIGVQSATTAQTQVESVIAPSQPLAVFPDTNNATRALKNGQIDALITDLPTTLYLAAVAVPGTVVGQLPLQESADTWGLVLQKDNPLVSCVNQALTQLKDDGTLQRITTRWMTDYAKAPVLK